MVSLYEVTMVKTTEIRSMGDCDHLKVMFTVNKGSNVWDIEFSNWPFDNIGPIFNTGLDHACVLLTN